MLAPVALRVLVLGAGFGGLELSTTLSEALGDAVEVTLVDQADAFVFGYSKLDVMFGRTTLDAVCLPYRDLVKPGVRFVREAIEAIDPEARRVTTDAGVHEADVLVVALGADYDLDATPGLADADEFYSVEGAARLSETLPEFAGGRVVIGVCGAPFKCPPAPSECALLLHDQLVQRGLREETEITFAIPFGTPVPPSPDTSAALLEVFERRDIRYVGGNPVVALDPARGVAVLGGDGGELPYDLFLGVPKHRAPDVVIASGMTVDGYVPVDSATLATRWPDVYAVGDVATVGVPKAGVFSEGAARVVAEQLIARVRGGAEPEPYPGRGSCFIEFGAGRVGRVDVDFLGGPRPTGTFQAPSDALVADKADFGATRRARWFGR